jgi:hypothetical protein
MSDAEAGARNSTETPAKPERRRSRLKQWLLWCSLVAVVIAVAIGVTIYILLQRAEPMLRASLIDTLQKRFHAKVELDELHVAILHGLSVEGAGLRIWLPEDTQAALEASGAAVGNSARDPWIVVGKMRFHVGERISPGRPIVISVIHVEDVRVLLPPKADRPSFNNNQDSGSQNGGQGSDTSAESGSKSGSGSSLFKLPPIQIRRIECQSVELSIERKQEQGKPPKLPLDFQLRKVTVLPDANGGSSAFEVDMINAKPVGVIHSTGHVGPWVSDDPGAFPVQGDYTFDHADLSTIKGIAGILSSTGRYQGTLREINADGHTVTPDFRLERVSKGKGVLLTTNFHAVIDGTNGDTYLQPVDATLGHTHIVARGQVVRASDLQPGAQGHEITLDVNIDHGRIEDVLNIAANAEEPFLTGNLALKTKFHIPHGKESVIEKLQLSKGEFELNHVQFNNDKMQGRIVELSLRGQGKPKEVKTTDLSTVFSEMNGHFELGDGKLQLQDLSYRVPGAEILAHGAYGLKDGTLAFEGDARLDATVSQVVGGWKGFLLKPADHFLKKNGAGTDVPIHIDGTRKDPKFGVDFGRIGKTDKGGDGQDNEMPSNGSSKPSGH